MSSFLDKVIFHLSQPKFNVIKTLFFNFKVLPFKTAVKLPVFIYGPTKFYWLKGKVEIHSQNIYRGMIKLGKNNEFFNGIDYSSFIDMGENARIIFDGPCAISNNYKIRVASNATLHFGAYTFLGSSIKFVCTYFISIGEYSRCAYESQFIDSNFHFVYNEKSKRTARRNGPIQIGSFNWIGNRTTINKGAKTKDYTIICAGSLLNKDFSHFQDEHQMLGGTPAKLLTSGIKRIFSTNIEKEIVSYFKKNETQETYLFNQDLKDDLDDIEYWFKHIM